MSRLWYDDEYSTLMVQNFLTLRAGLTNAAAKTLEDAGMERTRIPDIDQPPGGMDPLFWEAIWFETLSDDAALFAANNPTPEAANAAATLHHLSRITNALNAAGTNPMPLIEAAVFMGLATGRHIKTTGALPAEATVLAAKLEKVTAGLRRGPQEKQRLAELWRRPLRTFLSGLWEKEPATLRLDAPALWSLWLEREALVVERLRGNREVKWPSDRTAHGAVRDLVRQLQTAH